MNASYFGVKRVKGQGHDGIKCTDGNWTLWARRTVLSAHPSSSSSEQWLNSPGTGWDGIPPPLSGVPPPELTFHHLKLPYHHLKLPFHHLAMPFRLGGPHCIFGMVS